MPAAHRRRGTGRRPARCAPSLFDEHTSSSSVHSLPVTEAVEALQPERSGGADIVSESDRFTLFACRRPFRSAGVVLAAGAGTRYGMPKVLADQGGWLRAAVSALHGGGCDEVVVVLGAAIVDVPPPARAVIAEDWAEGLSASLRAGISALGRGRFRRAAHRRHPRRRRRRRPAGVVRGGARHRRDWPGPHYGGRPGHPVVLARRHWPDLLAGLRGDEGARPFLRARSDVIAVECGDLATRRRYRHARSGSATTGTSRRRVRGSPDGRQAR